MKPKSKARNDVPEGFGGSEMKNEITPGLWLLIIICAILFVFSMYCGICQYLMYLGVI